jgi:hypothetical protein
MIRAGRNRDQRAGPASVPGAIVMTAHCVRGRLLEHREELAAVGENGRDLRAILGLHPVSTPFCQSTTPSQRS